MSNLSAGVQILIDQLASNPDEFFGPIGYDAKRLYTKGPRIKFHEFERALRVLTLGQPGADGDFWFLTDEEKAALRVAYKEASRIRFDANVIASLHAQPEEANPTDSTVGFFTTKGHPGIAGREVMRLDANGALGIGTTAASTLTNSGYVISGSST